MINLTIPLYPYMPSGNVFPWDSPFQTEDIATLEWNAARLFYISMGSDIGTRLMAPALVQEGAAGIRELSLDSLLNSTAVILRIPKKRREAISEADIRKALQDSPAIQTGDALIVATGWGDHLPWKTMGEAYILDTPYFSPAAASFLSNVMKRNKVKLLLTDCALLDPVGTYEHHAQWLQMPAWLRTPYPSETAKAYLRQYNKEIAAFDWRSTRVLLDGLWVIAGLCNTYQLKTARVRLNCLPMLIENVGEAPCTVIAEPVDGT